MEIEDLHQSLNMWILHIISLCMRKKIGSSPTFCRKITSLLFCCKVRAEDLWWQKHLGKVPVWPMDGNDAEFEVTHMPSIVYYSQANSFSCLAGQSWNEMNWNKGYRYLTVFASIQSEAYRDPWRIPFHGSCNICNIKSLFGADGTIE